MKMFIGAIALIIAAPVAAQTTPAADPHAGHTPSIRAWTIRSTAGEA